jgi:hypothetical protein
MLPPPISPHQPTHGLALDRPSSSHIRTSSYRLTSRHERNTSSTSAGIPSEDDEDEELRRELDLEVEEQGGRISEREQGLEDTLERIGMGE